MVVAEAGWTHQGQQGRPRGRGGGAGVAAPRVERVVHAQQVTTGRGKRSAIKSMKKYGCFNVARSGSMLSLYLGLPTAERTAAIFPPSKRDIDLKKGKMCLMNTISGK